MISFNNSLINIVIAAKIIATITVLTLLSSCSHQSGWQSQTIQNANPVATTNHTSGTSSSPDQHPKIVHDNAAKSLLFPAKTKAFKPLPSTPTVSTKQISESLTGGDIVLRFSNTPVATVADIILKDYLGKDYEIAENVSGNINFDREAGLAEQDLIPVLETLLNSVNAKLVSNGAAYRIQKATMLGDPTLEDASAIISLNYISATEFVKILESASIQGTALERSNLVLASGSKSKLNQAHALAKSFDLNWLQSMSIGIFEILNSSAAQIKIELLEMIGANAKSSLAGSSRIVSLDRNNSIMIIAPSEGLVNQLGRWVKRLDQIDRDGRNDFYIYRAQNGKATDLAKLVNEMFAPSLDMPFNVTNNNVSTSNQPTRKARDFHVIADESTNSLIVTGSPHYFNKVRKAMTQLDSAPLQVLVEARIMELTLSDELEYGLEWFLNGSRANTQTSSRLDFGDAGINVPIPGFNYIVERAGEVRAAINALADDSRLKVLSSPALMVLNNQTANIRVGDEVPIPTRQAVSTISPDAPTVNEIEYRNTGILLTVTPRVNSSGMVTMDISQEVSSVTPNSVSQIDAPTIQQRQINSTISVQSGQTVVLGGLIRERQFEQDSGVPLLKQIPGLGKLFSTNSNRLQRTELVALITPRVIMTQNDAAVITQEFQQKMIGLKPLPLQAL